ncbi:hypothetical protein [Mycoplasma putrefaciens]|uniref:Rhomboid family n=1 Tax=Mycoplasma putrefaciens (strain ATCC 15718 / NCTC 10155 / C30 KS-1 / KS-1) TaxID=743965 RepID=A0A7U3ZSR3_MYCPK|nr:hypothetical protein [Mycoplasma putrefaciens]AEM68857.1 uncharacterized protein MPUT_0491 [Mycoplasma putrefaciens KS1]
MSKDFLKDKKLLEDFFISNYNTKLLKSKVNSSVSYLYSSANQYQVIVINFDQTISMDKELEYVVKKMQKSLDKPVQVFMIIIDKDGNNDLIEKPNTKILYSTIQNLKDNLEPFFDKTNLLNFDVENDTVQQKDQSKTQEASLEENLKTLNKFLDSFKNNKITFSWIILILLIIIPIVLQIASYFIFKEEFRTREIDTKAVPLIFGATNWELTILGGQWWRIFSYGLAPMQPSNSLFFDILTTLIVGTIFFNITKMAEIGFANLLKLSFTSIISYLILGLFASSVLPTTYTGGMLSTVGIFLGMLLMDASGQQTPVAKFSQAKAWTYIIMIIALSFFLGLGFNGLLITGIGMVLSSAIIGLLKTPVKKWSWMEIILVLLIIAIVVTSLVFLFLPILIPAVDTNILATLSLYFKKKVFSLEKINQITRQIGWQGSFNGAGNWINAF